MYEERNCRKISRIIEMTWEMFAVAYDENERTTNAVFIIEDDWIDGYYKDNVGVRYPFPEENWNFFFWTCTDVQSAKSLADSFDALNPSGDYTTVLFTQWLRYWADEGADFILIH
jgi:hypothetical protein